MKKAYETIVSALSENNDVVRCDVLKNMNGDEVLRVVCRGFTTLPYKEWGGKPALDFWKIARTAESVKLCADNRNMSNVVIEFIFNKEELNEQGKKTRNLQN